MSGIGFLQGEWLWCGVVVVARLCELLKDSSDRERLEGGLH